MSRLVVVDADRWVGHHEMRPAEIVGIEQFPTLVRSPPLRRGTMAVGHPVRLGEGSAHVRRGGGAVGVDDSNVLVDPECHELRAQLGHLGHEELRELAPAGGVDGDGEHVLFDVLVEGLSVPDLNRHVRANDVEQVHVRRRERPGDVVVAGGLLEGLLVLRMGFRRLVGAQHGDRLASTRDVVKVGAECVDHLEREEVARESW
mmetsp:Transcript_39391/g.83932  ORF Transcript_39391/g.83932 Transcript_39391/m.83932 type:complete len:203 (-) Transcript_39391:235-843(-)